MLENTESTAPLQTAAEGMVFGSVLTVLIIVVVGFIATGFIARREVRRESATTPQHSVLDYGNLIVVILGFLIALIGAILILLLVDDNAIAYITAWFGLITGLVGTFFGIKQSADARVGAERVANTGATAPTRDTTPLPLIVSKVSPRDGEMIDNKKPPVTAIFSKDMASTTINTNTFKLIKKDPGITVAGTVEYDPTNKRAIFTPSLELVVGSIYQATITTDVKAQDGTVLAQGHNWQFTIAQSDGLSEASKAEEADENR